MKQKLFMLVAVLATLTLLLTGCRSMSPERQAAVDAYDEQVARIEAQLEARDTAVKAGEDMLNKGLTPADVGTRSRLETALADAGSVTVDIPEMANAADAINAQAKELSAIDLSGQISDVESATAALEDSYKAYALQDAPWVSKAGGVWGVFENGALKADYNGLGTNDYGSWYVKNGVVDFSFSGEYTYSDLSFQIDGGKVL